ncbi:arogenate dehydratase prephenate dehydratase chloroplastic [Raphidocelis subcapitata]|uniref:Arogenate dehydratase n=1 Tax=Raphidocelis subcapitata TaxID=307507 RepID=A0A2V0PC46_9CHLO|nr:arogenate dehydratase prephenate dehydratase chloroplastic [Raphidocelis subcapitata]|eukprot:GBF95450.1 arogenate dehydratase prephenate dehydratase chloroplastic [Raphidocelis subcapitata]
MMPSGRGVASRSMAVQTDASAAAEAPTGPSAAGGAAAASGSSSSSGGARAGGVPPLRGLEGARLASPRSLTTALIARATNKTLDELNMSSKSPNRVAYQGVPGAYSEMAARKACPDCEPLPCDQFEVAFQALSQWMAEWAVLPIENSLGGSIHAVYDLLLRYRLHIVGETSVSVNHCLLALPGTKLGEVTRVLSHPQALAQVDGYLRKLKVVKEAVDDTAGAAQMVAEQKLVGVAAVASRRAAELYGLEILDEGIQDYKDNVTRFIKLSRDPLVTTDTAPDRPYKTSIVFSLKQGPGQLFKALSVFALRDIDMTKIESRPMRSNPILTVESGAAGAGEGTAMPAGSQRFNYLFYVDFVGTLAEPRCQNALRHLQESAPFLRVLGSYPMDLELGVVDSDKPPGFDGSGSGQA